MKKFLLACLMGVYAVWARGAVTFEQLSPEEKLGQTLVVFVDVDSAEQVRPVIESGNKMYHFAYTVSDIEKALNVFIKAKAKVVSPLKQSTYFGKRICFLLLPNMYMIELVEK